jgi:hypothetical protein
VGVLSLSIGLLRGKIHQHLHIVHCPRIYFGGDHFFLVWGLKVQHGPGWRRPPLGGGRAEDRRTKVRVLFLALCSVDMVLERDEKDF